MSYRGFLKSQKIHTPLGTVLAVADEDFLYVLTFQHQIQKEGLPCFLGKDIQNQQVAIVQGTSPPLKHIKQELKAYFSGTLKDFKTPSAFLGGSVFQKRVWDTLKTIPWGETRSYAQIALSLGSPGSYRAVGQANGANPLVLLIPCHRVINANKSLGGYSAGLSRKQWLLNHETQDAAKVLSNKYSIHPNTVTKWTKREERLGTQHT